jgi:hypothetical protein
MSCYRLLVFFKTENKAIFHQIFTVNELLALFKKNFLNFVYYLNFKFIYCKLVSNSKIIVFF